MSPATRSTRYVSSPIGLRTAAALAVLLVTAPVVASEIYRCVEDGVTVFADQPCDDNPEPHTPSGSVSVVAAAADLEQIADANRAFVDSRRARLAERQRLKAERARQRQLQRERAAWAAERAATRQRTYPARAAQLLADRRTEREVIEQRRREQADAPRRATSIGRAALLPQRRNDDPNG